MILLCFPQILKKGEIIVIVKKSPAVGLEHFMLFMNGPFSEDTNESQKIEHENDPEEDKAEIKEFLRKVRSHGSFKIIIGK